MGKHDRVASSQTKDSSKKTMTKTCDILIIGDPHIKSDKPDFYKKYIERMVYIAKTRKPHAVVLLGDIFDKHHTTDNTAFRLIYKLIDQLSKIAPTFVIVGNHDYIDSNQFLTKKHFLGPLKKWHNVTVVDYPTYISLKDKTFVLCPYVPPGRFTEALDKLVNEGHCWDIVDAIFAHQEFYGCMYKPFPSTTGDVWDEDYPPVFSGHIHPEQILGNVYYPGSSIQHSFAEPPNKKVWIVSFGDFADQQFKIDKISVGLKGKKLLYLDLDEIEEFDMELLEDYDVKIALKCDTHEYAAFCASKTYKILRSRSVIITHSPGSSTGNSKGSSVDAKYDKCVHTISKLSFGEILKGIVSTKSDAVQREFDELFGDMELMSETEHNPKAKILFETE